MTMTIHVVLSWISQGAPLTFKGAFGDDWGSLAGMCYVCMTLYLKQMNVYIKKTM